MAVTQHTVQETTFAPAGKSLNLTKSNYHGEIEARILRLMAEC